MKKIKRILPAMLLLGAVASCTAQGDATSNVKPNVTSDKVVTSPVLSNNTTSSSSLLVEKDIQLAYSNIKTNYTINEILDTTGLSVYLEYTNNSKELIKDYSIKVADSSNNIVSNNLFTKEGSYTVIVTYKTYSKNYTVTVSTNNSNNDNTNNDNTNNDNNNGGNQDVKKILNISFIGNESYNFDDVEIELTSDNVEPSQYLSYIPTGYTFGGYKQDSNWNLIDNEINVEMYIYPESTSDVYISFIDYDYEQISYSKYDINSQLDLSKITSPSRDGYTFIKWDYNTENTLTSNCYTKAIYGKNSEEKLNPQVGIDKTNKVNVYLNLDENITYDYNITLIGEDYSYDINTTLISLELVENNTYEISGYVTYLNNDEYNCIYLNSYSFDNVYYSSLNNLTEEKVQIVNYSNGFIVGTQEYIDAAPEGYKLSSIALYDSNDKLVKEEYYDGQYSVTFIGIEDGDYRVDAFYEKVESEEEGISLLRVDLGEIFKDVNWSEPTPGYRYHFVGFRYSFLAVVTDLPLCELKLMYKGELLYTQYYAKGQRPTNVFMFDLPIKYEGAKILGSLDYKEFIESDQVWELILSKDSDYNYYTVTFETKAGIVSRQVVKEGEAAIEPVIDKTYTRGNYLYTFKEWNKDFSNINSNIGVKALYDVSIIDENELIVSFEFLVSPDLITYHNTSNTYSGYTCEYYIIGGEYIKESSFGIPYSSFDSYYNSYSKRVTPNTDYEVRIYYYYTIAGTQDKKEVLLKYNIKTPNEVYEHISDDIFKLNKVTDRNMTFDFTDEVAGVYLKDENDYLYSYHDINVESYYFSNKEFDIFYYTYDDCDSNIAYGHFYQHHDDTYEMLDYLHVRTIETFDANGLREIQLIVYSDVEFEKGVYIKAHYISQSYDYSGGYHSEYLVSTLPPDESSNSLMVWFPEDSKYQLKYDKQSKYYSCYLLPILESHVVENGQEYTYVSSFFELESFCYGRDINYGYYYFDRTFDGTTTDYIYDLKSN